MASPAQDTFRADLLSDQQGYKAIELTKPGSDERIDIFPDIKRMGKITPYSTDEFRPDMVFNTRVGGIIGNKVAKLNFDVKVLEDKTADTIAEINVKDFNRQKLRHYETFISAQRFRKTTFKYTIEDMIDGEKVFGQAIPSVLLGRLINQRRRDREIYTYKVLLDAMKHFHTTGISIWDIGADGKVVKEGGTPQIGTPASADYQPAVDDGGTLPDGSIAVGVGEVLPDGSTATVDTATTTPQIGTPASANYQPAISGNGIWQAKHLKGSDTGTLHNQYGQGKSIMKRVQTWPTFTANSADTNPDRTLSEKFALLGDMDVYLSKIGLLTSPEYGNIHLEGLPKTKILTVMPQTVLNELAVNGARMINSMAQRDMQTGEILQGTILGSTYLVCNNLPMINISFNDATPTWKTIKVLKVLTGEFASGLYI